MCFLRDRPAAEALEMLELALPYRDVIAGVGLDSAEVGHPPDEFAEVYEKARAAGFVAVAHAGEEGPPQYIKDALDVLKVRRIDHGVAADRGPRAAAAPRRRAGIPLTMCPLSNLELQVTPDLSQHPLKRLLDAGLVVTVNSDDPAYFGGYLLDNYVAVERALGLSRHDLAQLARNSITASLLPAERKAALIEEIDRGRGRDLTAGAAPRAGSGGHAPVHDQRAAGDEAAVVARQKGDGGGQLFRPADALERVGVLHALRVGAGSSASAMALASIGVSKIAGLTLHTRTPSGPWSMARARVIITTPALAAE